MKLLAILISLLIVFTLVGCKQTAPVTEPAPVAEETPKEAPIEPDVQIVESDIEIDNTSIDESDVDLGDVI